MFRRNAQPHIYDMRKGGAWGFVPNKHYALWCTTSIACHLLFRRFLVVSAEPTSQFDLIISAPLSTNANFLVLLIAKCDRGRAEPFANDVHGSFELFLFLSLRCAGFRRV